MRTIPVCVEIVMDLVLKGDHASKKWVRDGEGKYDVTADPCVPSRRHTSPARTDYLLRNVSRDALLTPVMCAVWK